MSIMLSECVLLSEVIDKFLPALTTASVLAVGV